MAKTKDRPEQLHLDLRWEYIERVDKFSENFACYEIATQFFLDPRLNPPKPSPLWDEIRKSRY